MTGRAEAISSLVAQLNYLGQEARALGVHMDVFLTMLYKDDTTGTDMVSNHDSSRVRESLLSVLERIAEGDMGGDEPHEEHPVLPPHVDN